MLPATGGPPESSLKTTTPTAPSMAIVQVNDGEIMINPLRLKIIYKQLPGLKYILEEYPGMKMKANNSRSIIHEDFGINKADLILLLNFFSPSSIHPKSEPDWERLHDVAIIFGTSDVIDMAYKKGLADRRAESYRPLRPTEDVKDWFLWIVSESGEILPNESQMLFVKMTEGFNMVLETPTSNANFPTRYFRKRKMDLHPDLA